MSLVDQEEPKLVGGSDLEFSKSAPTDMTIQEMEELPYLPISQYREEGGDLQFNIPAHAEDYTKTDLTAFTCGIKVEHEDGTNLDADEQVGLENLPGSTIFRGMTVTVGNQVVVNDMHYGPNVHMTVISSYNKEAKESHLTSGLYFKDTAGRMNAHYAPPTVEAAAVAAAAEVWLAANPVPQNATPAQTAIHHARALEEGMQSAKDAQNQGLQKRARYTRRNRIIRVRANPFTGVFNLDKYLPNGVELKVTFIRAKPEVCLHAYQAPAAAQRYRVRIIDPKLWITRAKIFPPVFVAHQSSIEKKRIPYNLTRRVTRPLTIPQGTTSYTLDNVTTGQIPKRIIYGFISNAAYDGNYTQNPFNYEHLNLIRTSLYVNGKSYPLTAFTPVYTGDNPEYMREYNSVFSAIGIHHGNNGVDISRDDYPNGYCLYAFDLTPNKTAATTAPVTLKRTGNTRIEFQLSEATAVPYVCMVFAEYDNIMKIDAARNVYVDYSL
jgi:hypothetical protein